MSRVVVFCDFNGVVNLPQRLFESVGVSGRVSADNMLGAYGVDSSVTVSDLRGPSGVYGDTVVDFSSKMVDDVNRFVSDSKVVWYWLSSWKSSVLRAAGLMGFDFTANVASWKQQGSGFDFKAETVKDFMSKNPDVPVIWVDDVAAQLLPDGWWKEVSHVSPLVVVPSTFVGLTGEHLVRMYEYVASHG